MADSGLDEAIGSMLMVGVRGAEPGDPRLREDLERCRSAHVGGIVLFDVDVFEMRRLMAEGDAAPGAAHRAERNVRSPEQLAALIEHLRATLGMRLLVGVDQEGGAVARLKPERGFEPACSPAEFGAMDPRDRLRHASAQARQLGDAGIDVNFAPCVDLAINPEGPVIGALGRCFGDDPGAVVACAEVVIAAHNDAGVHTCLKHFPGHGSAAGDTHDGFVDVTGRHRDAEIDPYRMLIGRPGVGAVMTGHLLLGSIDREHPASLSGAHTTGLLREGLGFGGVVVTDSLDMGAITRRYGRDEALVLAINAGADLLLDAGNIGDRASRCRPGEAHRAIREALGAGRIDGGAARISESARRIARIRRG